MPKMHTILRLLVLGAFALASLGARAADWPAQPIKLIVPWAPGGFTDVFGRIVADKLTKSLGQQLRFFERRRASDRQVLCRCYHFFNRLRR